jgi:N-glycosylase/DNA lyase|tara:strand:+ start:84 stop:269 length:186 start_codon:yes stop_codon:yes gene_type:complete
MNKTISYKSTTQYLNDEELIDIYQSRKKIIEECRYNTKEQQRRSDWIKEVRQALINRGYKP